MNLIRRNYFLFLAAFLMVFTQMQFTFVLQTIWGQTPMVIMWATTLLFIGMLLGQTLFLPIIQQVQWQRTLYLFVALVLFFLGTNFEMVIELALRSLGARISLTAAATILSILAGALSLEALYRSSFFVRSYFYFNILNLVVLGSSLLAMQLAFAQGLYIVLGLLLVARSFLASSEASLRESPSLRSREKYHWTKRWPVLVVGALSFFYLSIVFRIIELLVPKLGYEDFIFLGTVFFLLAASSWILQKKALAYETWLKFLLGQAAVFIFILAAIVQGQYLSNFFYLMGPLIAILSLQLILWFGYWPFAGFLPMRSQTVSHPQDYQFNTIGNLLGLLVGFLFSVFDFEYAILAFIIGVVGFYFTQTQQKNYWLPAILLAATLMVCGFSNVETIFLQRYTALFNWGEYGELSASPLQIKNKVREQGRVGALVKTISPSDEFLSKGVRLVVDGQASNMGRLKEMLQAMVHLPETPAPRILILGLGGHQILSVIEHHLKVSQINNYTIDVIDNSPVFASLAFRNAVGALHDFNWQTSRANFILGDAVNYLYTSDKSYDAIYWNLPDPIGINLGRLYSAGFFTQIKNHLRENGSFIGRIELSFAYERYLCQFQKSFSGAELNTASLAEGVIYFHYINSALQKEASLLDRMDCNAAKPISFLNPLFELDFYYLSPRKRVRMDEWLNFFHKQRKPFLEAFNKDYAAWATYFYKNADEPLLFYLPDPRRLAPFEGVKDMHQKVQEILLKTPALKVLVVKTGSNELNRKLAALLKQTKTYRNPFRYVYLEQNFTLVDQ